MNNILTDEMIEEAFGSFEHISGDTLSNLLKGGQILDIKADKCSYEHWDNRFDCLNEIPTARLFLLILTAKKEHHVIVIESTGMKDVSCGGCRHKDCLISPLIICQG